MTLTLIAPLDGTALILMTDRVSTLGYWSNNSYAGHVYFLE